MPKGTKILTDVPEDERKTIIEGFEGEGAKVTCKEEPEGSGKFKITAEFPDSDAEDNQTTSSSSTADKKNPGAAKMGNVATTPKSGTSSSASTTLKKDGIPWVAQIDGDDIVVGNVLVTAFGGGNDEGDNGQTESGVMNDGSNPNLMGCALPIQANEAATKNSPLAFKPPIPWHTKVRFWRGEDETSAIETELIDNGPNVLKFPDHAGDLTVAVAHKFAPGIALKDLANNFEMILSYRIIGGAKAAGSGQT